MTDAETGALDDTGNEVEVAIEASKSLQTEINRTLWRGVKFLRTLVVVDLILLFFVGIIPDTSDTLNSWWDRVREARGSWDTDVLLTIPITVLIPALLTVLFATTGPGAFGQEERTIREQAHLEVLKRIILAGLKIGGCLALFALIPSDNRVYLPDFMLAAGVALACGFMAPMLGQGPTFRRAAIAAATKRISELDEYREDYAARITSERPKWCRWFKNENRLSSLLLYVLVAGICSVLGLSAQLVILLISSESLVFFQWLLLAVLPGLTGLGIAVGVALWRLAEKERAIYNLFVIHGLALSIVYIVYTLIRDGIAPNILAYSVVLAIATVVALVVGWSIAGFRTLAACIGYHQATRLNRFEESVRKEMERSGSLAVVVSRPAGRRPGPSAAADPGSGEDSERIVWVKVLDDARPGSGRGHGSRTGDRRPTRVTVGYLARRGRRRTFVARYDAVTLTRKPS